MYNVPFHAQVQVGSETLFYVMEPFLDGVFIKFNSNRHDGAGFHAEEKIHLSDDGDAQARKAMVIASQAISCWSWKYTEETSLLCDVQGIGSFLFDPAWVTRRASAEAPTPYGASNVGALTIKRFFQQHSHDENPICQALKTIVPPPASLVFANLVLTVHHTNGAAKKKIRDKILQCGGALCNTNSHSKVRASPCIPVVHGARSWLSVDEHYFGLVSLFAAFARLALGM